MKFKYWIYRILILIFTATIGFHILILFGAIPYSMVWGGRLTSWTSMLVFELFSLILNSYFLFVMVCKAGILKTNVPPVLLSISCWIMGALFLFNTLGNAFSLDETERIIFTPITAVLCVLCFLVAPKNDSSSTPNTPINHGHK
ncbi:MAG: hypothetical protein IPK96_11760 [Flammeovirgaceae bacterium]|jgi:hypothetical protein|nr:hypothetical protein [Flammeovirgaceae bacterium]